MKNKIGTIDQEQLTELRQDLDRLREENRVLRESLETGDAGRVLLQRSGEFMRLLSVSKSIVSELDLGRVFQLVADNAREIVQAVRVLVPMLNDPRDRYTYVAASGADAEVIRGVSYGAHVGMCGWVLRNERCLLFGETTTHWMDDTTVWEAGQESAVLVPLVGRKGIIGGLSALGKLGGGCFTQHDLDLLTMFANQVSIAIENAKLFHELKDEIKERTRTERLLAVRLELSLYAAGHPVADLMQKTLDLAEEITGSTMGLYHSVDEERRSILLQQRSTRTVREFGAANDFARHHVIEQAGALAECIKKRQPVICNDSASLPDTLRLFNGHARPVREMMVPVIRKNRVEALFSVGNKGQDYSEKDMDRLISLVNFAWDIAGRKRIDEKVAQQAEQIQALLDLHEISIVSPQDILASTQVALQKISRSSLSFFGFLDDAESQMTVPAWSSDVMSQCAMEDKPLLYPIAGAGVWAECIRQRKPFVLNDYDAAHSGKKGLLPGHVPLSRILSVPVFEGQRIVMVAIVANKETDYDESDISAVSVLMNKVWEISERRKAEEQVRRLNEELEQRVKDRTAELERKNQVLAKLNKAFVGREIRMIELKKQIADLEAKITGAG